MSMVIRKVQCKKCGEVFRQTYPEGLSPMGLSVISYCPACMRQMIRQVNKEVESEP